MIDPNSTGKIIDEASKLAPEIYKDLAKPAVKEIGDVTGRSVKALLSPVRGFLWGWEKIEQLVVDGVNKRFERIPEEQRKTPDPEIAVPLMQALSYTAQNETLREMYLNLLANSMDSAKEKDVHPSFVELIKQMNSLDAKVFDRVAMEKGYQKAINPRIAIIGGNKYFVDATPEWFVGWVIPTYDAYDVSSSLVRLSKFGLIDLLFDRTAGERISETLKTHQDLISILNRHQLANPSLELEIRATDSLLIVNEYGQQFQKACK